MVAFGHGRGGDATHSIPEPHSWRIVQTVRIHTDFQTLPENGKHSNDVVYPPTSVLKNPSQKEHILQSISFQDDQFKYTFLFSLIFGSI